MILPSEPVIVKRVGAAVPAYVPDDNIRQIIT